MLHPHQIPPAGYWKTWLLLGGRGSGKTFAGANWISSQAVPGAALAIVGPDDEHALHILLPEIMRLPQWTDQNRPVFDPGRREITFPTGGTARLYSAKAPARLQGPNFSAAWGDDVEIWSRPEDAFRALRMGSRVQPGKVMLTGRRALGYIPFMSYDVVTHPEAIENPFLTSTPET